MIVIDKKAEFVFERVKVLIKITVIYVTQQLEICYLRSTNNETPVEQPVPFLWQNWSLAGTTHLL
ncbi:hypothetical protein ACNQGB_14940 [Flavobacterium sp. XS1P32]|uniref:hypothetical protein n=1 Tax=unclassified Flavobacterium TaxID=196869 RepID=UPI003AAE9FB0